MKRAGMCVVQVMREYRVCLAPLRFGAGLKGKVVDAWAHGMPVCTTPVGAEGMCGMPALGGSPDQVLLEHAASFGNCPLHA